MKVHLGLNCGFLESFIKISKQADDLQNHFFIIYGKPVSGTIFKDKNIVANLNFVDTLENSNPKVINLINESSTIFIHFLSDEVIYFLEKCDLKNKKIVWLLWGTDGFSLPEVYNNLSQFRFDYLTKIGGKIKRVFYKKKSAQNKLNFINRIDYVAHYIQKDFELLQPLLKPSAKLVYFTYGVLEHIVEKIDLQGSDIILGNSAAKTNNHLFALQNILPKNSDKIIYCPLSYAADEDYINDVIKTGTKLFGNQFKPYTELLETSNYYSEVLSKTKFAIMAHNRSQAWGNIMQLLWQGSQVYMFKSNNLYKFLKQRGFIIFALDKKNKLNYVDEEVDLTKNRILLEQQFSINVLLEHYKKLLLI